MRRALREFAVVGGKRFVAYGKRFFMPEKRGFFWEVGTERLREAFLAESVHAGFAFLRRVFAVAGRPALIAAMREPGLCGRGA